MYQDSRIIVLSGHRYSPQGLIGWIFFYCSQDNGTGTRALEVKRISWPSRGKLNTVFKGTGLRMAVK